MPKPAPRAWPRPPMAGRLIGNYMPIDGAAVEDRQNQGCQATGSIASLNCSCGTRYAAPKPLHRPSRSTDSAAMDSKKRDVGNASSSSGNASSSSGNASSSSGNASSSSGNASSSTGRSDTSAIEVTTSVMLRNERAKPSSISSIRPRADVDNFSWPSRRTSDQQDADIPDSAVDLMTPKMKAKAERLRESKYAPKRRASSLGSRPRFTGDNDVQVYPSLPKTVLIMLSLYVSIFLVALDRTILGPAIPAITNQFNSIKDIGWYSSAYMLTSCGFILLYGRIYTFFPTKPVFLSGIVLFEIGSAICGAAQNSVMLITGRAIAGLGSSGVFTGAILIMLNTVPLHKRPLLQGLFGACFGVASVTGPLLGGAFTESGLTWRWCFYINIPLGGITIVVVSFLLDLKEHKPPRKDWRDTIRQMDPVGTILFLPGITCLLLALEWGAADYAWSSPRLVGLLTAFAILFTAFAVWQYYTRNTTATVPTRILLQRSIACGCASQFCVGATMLTISVYMPLWFQAIKGVSAFQSGANSLPLVLSTVFASILSGGVIQKVGYYTPFMIFGSCCMALGTGLITTLTMDTEKAKWIGYLIIIGIGVGFSMQHANLAVQAILKKRDIPIGTAMLSLCQTLGGAVFTAVGQNLYIDKFADGLRNIEGVDVGRVLNSGATALTNSVPPNVRGEVLKAYNNSLTHGTFYAVLFVACLSVPAALGMEWRSVKQDQPAKKEKSTEDIEMGASKKGGAMKSESVEDQMLHAGIQQEGSGLIAPPALAWKKDHRPSGNFSQWLTVKVNPDLRLELGATR